MIQSLLQRTNSINTDVSNEKPSCKQDCRDIINISVFFDGTGNNKKMMKIPKGGQILLDCGKMLVNMH